METMKQLNKIHLRGQITHMKCGKVGSKMTARLCVRTTHAIDGDHKIDAGVVKHIDHNVWVVEGQGVKVPLDSLKAGDWVTLQGYMSWGTFVGIDNLPHTSFEIVATRLVLHEGAEPTIII